MAKRINRSYTAEQRALGMTVTALCNGDTVLAHKHLLGQGVDIPATTLRHWRLNSEPEYRGYRERLLPRILDNAAEGADRVVSAATELELEALERMRKALPDLPDRDLAGFGRNVSTMKGINVDKSLELRGHPTTNPDHGSYEEIINALRAKDLVVDTEATEIPEEHPALPTRQS